MISKKQLPHGLACFWLAFWWLQSIKVRSLRLLTFIDCNHENASRKTSESVGKFVFLYHKIYHHYYYCYILMVIKTQEFRGDVIIMIMYYSILKQPHHRGIIRFWLALRCSSSSSDGIFYDIKKTTSPRTRLFFDEHSDDYNQ